jgi:RHS repeat-associated protein
VAEEQFVWNVAYIDGLILRDRNADLNNATGAGGLEQRVYALQDALWNTTALVDVNGNVLNRFAYTPYGVVETLNPNWTPTASPSIPWAVLFRGYFADEGTGLLHARARQYSPTLGRFVSRDPLGYLNGFSVYKAYFVPDSSDPFGLATYTGDYATLLGQMPEGSELGSYTPYFTAAAKPATSDCVCIGKDDSCPDKKKYKCDWKGKIEVTAGIGKTDLPVWKNRGKPTKEQVAKWNSFYDAVSKHEQGHHAEAVIAASDYNATSAETTLVSIEGCFDVAKKDIDTKMGSKMDAAIDATIIINDARQLAYHKLVKSTIDAGKYLN